MYPVSNEYKAKISQSNINDEITGTIVLTDNTIINFTDEDIKENSFYFKESCVAGQTLEYGNVNSSLLVLSLFTYLENIYSLDGAMIKPVYRLELDNGNFEEVPLGTFFVTKIERQDDAVKLEAMDGMVLLNKSILGVATAGTARNIILSLCGKCGVTLSTNATTFSTFPNHSVNLSLESDSKVETCLDLLMWVCSCIGCSARFGRTGKLEIRLITGGTSSKVVSSDEQMLVKLSDFSSKITGIKYGDILVGNENGIVLKQDANPLWADKTETQITAYLTNILNKIVLADYVSGSAEIWGDPAIQAGDYITLEDTIKGDVKLLVTSHSWHYRGKHSITSAGASDKVAKRFSQGEKAILSAVKKADKAAKQATLADEKAQEAQDLVEQAKFDFNTAISDLNGELGSVTSQIGDIKSDVTGIQAEYATLHAEIYDTTDGIVKRMTSVETDIGVVAGQITSKVSQDEYDEYVSITGDTITQIESDLSLIEQTASSISATVAGQSVLIDGLQTSYADLQTQIDVQAGKIEQTVTKTEFNNLEIGGRNLVPNSATRLFKLYQLSGSSTLVDESDNSTGKVGIYEITDGTGFLYTPLGELPLKIGEIYTVSFYIKADKILDTGNVYGNGLSILSSNLENVVTTDYKKVIVTIRKNADGNNNFHLSGIGENSKPFTVYIHSFQVEKGTKPTDWTPAPEDVEKQIDTAYDNATSYADSKISQTASGIISTVSESYATKTALSNVNNKFSDYYTKTQSDSKISQLSDAIALKVSTSTYNNGISAKADKTALATTDKNIASLQDELDDIDTRLSDAELKITDSAIISTVTSSTTYKNNLSAKANQSSLDSTNSQLSSLSTKVVNTETKISQLSDEIELKVSKDGIISTINQTAESIKIDASKINIANFTIKNDMLYSGIGNNTILLKPAGKVRFAVGLPLSMIQSGSRAIDGNYHAVSTATYLTQEGFFKSGNAEITGKITTSNLTASGGEIAGWGISTNFISSTDTTNKRYTMLNSGKGGSEFCLIVGMSTEDSSSTPAAYIKHDGSVYFSKGEFNGKITSGSGTIGGWTIGSSNIRSGSGEKIVFLSGGTSDYALWAGNANATIAPLQLKKDGTLISGTSDGGVTIKDGRVYFRSGFSTSGDTTRGQITSNDSSLIIASPNTIQFNCSGLKMNTGSGYNGTVPKNYTPVVVNGIVVGISYKP